MARFESVTGRYVYLKVQGVEYRVYFEEDGTGIPLICQHTAGADSRQYRHMMNDRDVTSRFRVIAFDLPFHGRSLPPESVEWWKEEYLLHRDFLLDFHVAFIKALGLERPVYIGCSMGGHFAPDLALERPDAYRAVIGVEGGLASPEDPVRLWFYHPKISNDYKFYSMMSLMSPTSPEKYRRETGFEVLAYAGDAENRGDPVGQPHVDTVTGVESPEAEENGGPPVGIDVAFDDRCPHLAGRGGVLVPRGLVGPRVQRRHLDRAVGVDPQVQQFRMHADGRYIHGHRHRAPQRLVGLAPERTENARCHRGRMWRVHLGADRDADGGDPGHDEQDPGQPGHPGPQADRRPGRRGGPRLRPGHDHAEPGYPLPLHLRQPAVPSLLLPQGVIPA